jgi:hypothetical protein
VRRLREYDYTALRLPKDLVAGLVLHRMVEDLARGRIWEVTRMVEPTSWGV